MPMQLLVLLICLLPFSSASTPPNLVRIDQPIDGIQTSDNGLKIGVSRIVKKHPIWSKNSIQLCIQVVQHDFLFRNKYHNGEKTGRQCWNDIHSRENFFPLQAPMVELKIYANYTVIVYIVDGEQIIDNVSSTFSYAVPRQCKERLNRATDIVQVPYNSNDPYHTHHLSPLCLGATDIAYIHNNYNGRLGSYLSTNSGFRGTFGVDHTAQEFGHGDNMMLHYVLNKYRADFSGGGGGGHFIEMGSFAGVTSLTLGVAAKLRYAEFHSFDIVDNRPMNVRQTWLSNMHHHLLDIDACYESDQASDQVTDHVIAERCGDLVTLLQNTSLLMVDHAHGTRLAAAVTFGKMLKNTQPATIIVHDFPAGRTIEEWQDSMASIGFQHVHDDIRILLFSTLAMFRRDIK